MFTRKNLQKGFTLIELLVVVAIIGILSAIVLTSLQGARRKANDASASGSMSSVRASAEIYYDTNDVSYAGVCTDSDVDSLLDAAQRQTGNPPVCASDATAFAATIELITPDSSGGARYFCVDSTGFAGTSDSQGTAVGTQGLTQVVCQFP